MNRYENLSKQLVMTNDKLEKISELLLLLLYSNSTENLKELSKTSKLESIELNNIIKDFSLKQLNKNVGLEDIEKI